MQRNWIGRSKGARVTFPTKGGAGHRGLHHPARHAVRRHLHGAGARAPAGRRADRRRVARRRAGVVDGRRRDPAEAVAAYRRRPAGGPTSSARSSRREKTGVFTGAYAVNPTTGTEIPVFVADYVLMGYGTGAIMAVPGQDERDWAFAEVFGLPIVRTVAAARATSRARRTWVRARRSTAPTTRCPGRPGGRGGQAADHRLAGGATAWAPARSPTSCATGCSAGSATGASRSRSSTTPTTGCPGAVPDSMLPVCCPRWPTTPPPPTPTTTTRPSPSRRWSRADRLGDRRARPGRGPRRYRRETNTMPNWAGSCWYHLRYIDPVDDERLVDPENEAYWMGPRDAGRSRRRRPVRRRRRARRAAPAVLPLLAQGAVRPGPRVVVRALPPPVQPGPGAGLRVHRRPGHLRPGRRGRSSATAAGSTRAGRSTGRWAAWARACKNAVAPDEMYASYGADTLRLYEMFTGPLDQPARGTPRPSSASTACCSASGATWSTRTPAR